ncbi:MULTISPECIES: NF038120 family PEP-CTERM protein [unclassified Janthinobacterium]|uniref:NF038120 family PEP-CTERM protein n=1 Tax=unclassified Janthinobacterium TaxID=2610881 RepID=UPI0018CA7391|nr:NF038120 family PEP-CTERM protein [Janthinobacterium sp. CG_23.4]MDH6156930.1 hypothetical protein [Janthinobacterium sp. CG_23.4]
MTRIVHPKVVSAASPFSAKQWTGAAILALSAACAPAAMADVINFNNLDSQYVGHGSALEIGKFRLTGASNVAGASFGDLVGAVYDGTDPAACGMACPTNNTSNYYASLNDGIAYLDPLNQGGRISLQGFDASFIGYAQGVTYPAVAGLLRVQGFYANGSSLYETYQLGGPVGGNFQFQHYNTSANFGSQQFASLAFFGFTCNTAGNCNAFSTNKGQFALDNIVASVPEPSTYAMLLLGLACVGFAARRRQQA